MTGKQRLATGAVFALIALYGFFVTRPAMAQTGQAVLSCTPPTKNTDGSNITGAITYRFYRGSQTNQATAGPVQTVCAYTFTGLAVGTHWFSVTATVGGFESAKSPPVSKVIPPTAPAPPTNLVVQPDNLTAYSLSQSPDRLVMLPVGTVASSTVCDGSMSANGLYRVPVASVTLAGNIRPPVVFAACSPG